MSAMRKAHVISRAETQPITGCYGLFCSAEPFCAPAQKREKHRRSQHV